METHLTLDGKGYGKGYGYGDGYGYGYGYGDGGKEQNRCILRLRTITWTDNKGLHIKRSLTYLRRQCVGFNGLAEDASAIGAEHVVGSITNLAECKDGIYEAVVCNVSHDWETGYADDWDYRLVPISTGNV